MFDLKTVNDVLLQVDESGRARGDALAEGRAVDVDLSRRAVRQGASPGSERLRAGEWVAATGWCWLLRTAGNGR